ncbi:MAG: tetratricopeptide repeat protein [Gammaproteobacteria bacterium]
MSIVFLLSCFWQSVVAADMWTAHFEKNLASAQQGNADAEYETGIMYLKGQGTIADRVEGLEWLQRAADQGHSKATRKLAREQKNSQKFSRLVKKAEQGNANAQYDVGMMLDTGRGTNIDHQVAFNWLSMAAEQGHKKSLTQMGIRLYKGEGVSRDAQRAVEQFSKVADSEVIAQYYLGEAYAEGMGVKKDLEESLTWYNRAAVGGFGRAVGKAINIEEQIKRGKHKRTQVAKESSIKKTIEKAPVVTNVVAPLASPTIKKVVRSKAKPKIQQKPKVKVVRNKYKKPVKKKSRTKLSRSIATRPAVNTSGPASIIRELDGGKNNNFGIDYLLNKKWSSNGKLMSFLPSSLNDCTREKKRIVCFSRELQKQRMDNKITFKVKSFITKIPGSQDSFTVTYKNLVLDVEKKQHASEDESSETGFRVKTGWTRKHVARCTYTSSKTLKCIKDGTHRIDVQSRNY